jgi:CheY-like chemotaxis protein
VYDGVEALKIAAEFRPDVVLLDIGVPGLDGYEVARRLRSSETDRRLRIVAVTGWGQDTDRKMAKEVGFDVHLIKPMDENELAEILRTGRQLSAIGEP